MHIFGAALRGCGKKSHPGARNATTRAEARTILNALRGAEAPLFHGSAGIAEFFRSLFKPCPGTNRATSGSAATTWFLGFLRFAQDFGARLRRRANASTLRCVMRRDIL
jgi:hypothetical protein